MRVIHNAGRKTFLLSIVLSIACFAVKAQQKDIIKNIDFLQLPVKKSTMVFIAMPSCSAAMEDLVLMAPTVLAQRDHFNLVVIVDSTYYKKEYGKYFKAVNDLKPDKTIAVNDYYPTAFKSRKEGKLLGRLIKSHYPECKFKMVGTGAIWITDCNQKLVDLFTLYQKGLGPFEKELKELPECN